MSGEGCQVTEKEGILPVLQKVDASHLSFAVSNMPYYCVFYYKYEWRDDFSDLCFIACVKRKMLNLMRKNDFVCSQLNTNHI